MRTTSANLAPRSTGSFAPRAQALSLEQAKTMVLSSGAVVGLEQHMGGIDEESRPSAIASVAAEPAPAVPTHNWGAYIAPVAQFVPASTVLEHNRTEERIHKLEVGPAPGSTAGEVAVWDMAGLC